MIGGRVEVIGIKYFSELHEQRTFAECPPTAFSLFLFITNSCVIGLTSLIWRAEYNRVGHGSVSRAVIKKTSTSLHSSHAWPARHRTKWRDWLFERQPDLGTRNGSRTFRVFIAFTGQTCIVCKTVLYNMNYSKLCVGGTERWPCDTFSLVEYLPYLWDSTHLNCTYLKHCEGGERT